MHPELSQWIPPAVIVGFMLYLHRITRQDMGRLRGEVRACAVKSPISGSMWTSRTETCVTAWVGSRGIWMCCGISSSATDAAPTRERSPGAGHISLMTFMRAERATFRLRSPIAL